MGDCDEGRSSGKSPHQDLVVDASKLTWLVLFTFSQHSHIVFLIVGILLSVLAGLIVPVQSYLLGKIFRAFADFGSGETNAMILKQEVTKYSTYLTGLGVIAWLFHSGSYMAWMMFGEMAARNCRETIFKSLLHKNMTWFDRQTNGISALLPRLRTETQDLRLAISQPFGYVFQCLSSSIGCLAIAFYFSWSLTLVVLSTIPITALAVGYLSGQVEINILRQGKELQSAMGSAISAFSLIDVVKSFNSQKSELWRISQQFRAAGTFLVRSGGLSALELGFIGFTTYGMFVQGFWYGGILVRSGKRDAGQVMTTFWAAIVATQSVAQLLPQLVILEKGRLAGAKLQLCASKKEAKYQDPSARGGDRPFSCAGCIKFDKVTFSYPSRVTEVVLRKASFTFPSGETTFVVGKSGSGKSTIGQLLLRLYQPILGKILLDDRNIDALDAGWLRENITLLEQNSVLFNDTVFNNITFGRQDYKTIRMDEVQEAAEFALLLQVLNDMPQGFQTLVGGKGMALSGGQRQRIALARARLRDTPVLILDESTSALDNINCSLILDAIRNWRTGKTTIIITHDMSHILPEDFVLIFDEGRPVQEGYRRDLQRHTGNIFQELDSNTKQCSLPGGAHQRFSRLFPTNVASISEDYIDSIISKYNVHPPQLNANWSNRSEDITSTYSLASEPSEISRRSRRISSIYTPIDGAPMMQLSQMPPVVAPFWQVMPRQTLSEAFGLAGESPPLRRRNGSISPTAERDFRQFRNGGEFQSYNSMLYAKDELVVSANKIDMTPDSCKRSNSNTSFSSIPKEKSLTLRSLMKTVWPALNPSSHVILVLALIASSIMAATTPIFSYIFAELLSVLFLSGHESRALSYTLSILGLASMNGVATFFGRFLFEVSSERWVCATRLEALRRILAQPKEFFDSESHSISRLAESLDHYAEDMRGILARFASLGYVALLMLVIAVLWSLAMCWKLTLVALAAIPAMYLITRCYAAICQRWDSVCSDSDEVSGGILTETITSLSTVRCLRMEKVFLERYQAASTNTIKLGIKRAIYTGLFFGLTESAILCVTALLFWVGGILVANGDFTAQEVLRTFSILLISLATANATTTAIPQISLAQENASRLVRLARLPLRSHEDAGDTRITEVGNIRFHNVDFAYPTRPTTPVLRNVSFTIPAGSSVSIVGSSGSGKSTIASLLLKLYPTTNASNAITSSSGITFSNRDIHKIHTPTLRSLIAMVPQTPTIFPLSIAENISYGLSPSHPFSAPSSVAAAAEAAGIHSFIASLPQGYNTLVGEGGTGLSGGQAQRIVIARALVRKPNVLILDEATSALDEHSTSIVRESVRNLISNGHGDEGSSRGGKGRTGAGSCSRSKMTVIIITHAKEMMKVADNIIMMEQGKVVETGRYEELARRPRGRFARLLRGG